MRKTLALAALLAATAFTPVSAQNVEIDAAGAVSPRAVDMPPSEPMQLAQNEERRERGRRGGADGGDNAGRVEQSADPQRAEMRAQRMERMERRDAGGGWQPREQVQEQVQAPAVSSAPAVQVQPPQTPAQWNRSADGAGMGWRGRDRAADGAATGAFEARQGGRDRDSGDRQRRWAQPVQPSVAPDQRVQRNDTVRDGARFDRRDTWRDNAQGNAARNDGVRIDRWRNDDRGRQRWGDQGQSWHNRGQNWNWNRNGQNWSGQNWSGQNWNRSWRNDRQYDWQRYRFSNRNLFSNQRYYAPYGWNYGYRRFSVGFSLSSILFDQQYWIDDPYSYRLPPAYGPYRWVRYYDDVMLVDLRTGQVIDAVYDFFY